MKVQEHNEWLDSAEFMLTWHECFRSYHPNGMSGFTFAYATYWGG